MLLIETIFGFSVMLTAFVCPALGSRWFERFERWFSRLANRRALAAGVVGLSTLAIRIAVLPVESIPQPSLFDEFSYLLQADTFAHGRLTNRTPPMWQHFETFHEIFQPTYCSKFFPGQGLFLALGKVVFGHPYWGVWLTSGLMCAAITWMLQGWFSPEFAFLGGAITLLRFGVFGYWADSYWGGNVAAIGGALVIGALPRIKSTQRPRHAVLMGVGLALLAISRPWEGLVLSLPAALLLFTWILLKNSAPLAISLRQVLLPLALVLVISGGWLAYYCWRTTGHPLRTPYQVYEQTYGAYPYMIWQNVRPEPAYRHSVMRELEIGQVGAEYRSSRITHMLRSFLAAVLFFLGPILLVPFVTLLFVLPYGFSWRDIRSPTPLFMLLSLIFAAGTELVLFYNPHYSAPALCLIMALLLCAMGRLRYSGKSGLFITRAIPLTCFLLFGLRVAALPLHISKSPYSTYYWYMYSELHSPDWFQRAAIENKLEAIHGDHLVIVSYRPQHLPAPDWVFNDAEIDSARIVWARDMGRQKNRELLKYFKDRQAWLLEADEKPPRLVPYSEEEDALANRAATSGSSEAR